MDVHFRLVGQVEVEHVGDVFNVNTTTGNIGRHEDKDFSVLEPLKCSRARRLALIAVDGIGGYAHLFQLLCKSVCTVLGAREDDAAGDHLSFQEVNEQLSLVGFANKGNVLFNAVGGGCFGADVHVNGLVSISLASVPMALGMVALNIRF